MRAVLIVALVWGWVGLLAGLTRHRVATVWPTDVTLWADALTDSASKPRVLVNYGAALDHAGDPTHAVDYYLQAIAACRDRRDAHCAAYRQLALANLVVSRADVPSWVIASGMRLAGCVDTPAGDAVAGQHGGVIWTCHGRLAY